MAWKPKTLRDALDNEPDFEGPRAYQRQPHSPIRYRCDCGGLQHAEHLIDLRGVPEIDQDWACDACRSSWRRERRVFDGSSTIIRGRDRSRKESAADWTRRFLGLLGAPDNHIAAVQAAPITELSENGKPIIIPKRRSSLNE